MKIYLASRTRHSQKMIEIAKLLETKGHQVVSDWIYIDEKLKPFTQNLQRVQEISVNNVKAMLSADMLLLFNDLSGTDIFTEMGVCIANKELNKKDMKLYVVGEYDQTSLMQLHPSITHFINLQEVFDFEKIDYSDFTFPELK